MNKILLIGILLSTLFLHADNIIGISIGTPIQGKIKKTKKIVNKKHHKSFKKKNKKAKKHHKRLPSRIVLSNNHEARHYTNTHPSRNHGRYLHEREMRHSHYQRRDNGHISHRRFKKLSRTD